MMAEIHIKIRAKDIKSNSPHQNRIPSETSFQPYFSKKTNEFFSYNEYYEAYKVKFPTSKRHTDTKIFKNFRPDGTRGINQWRWEKSNQPMPGIEVDI